MPIYFTPFCVQLGIEMAVYFKHTNSIFELCVWGWISTSTCDWLVLSHSFLVSNKKLEQKSCTYFRPDCVWTRLIMYYINKYYVVQNTTFPDGVIVSSPNCIAFMLYVLKKHPTHCTEKDPIYFCNFSVHENVYWGKNKSQCRQNKATNTTMQRTGFSSEFVVWNDWENETCNTLLQIARTNRFKILNWLSVSLRIRIWTENVHSVNWTRAKMSLITGVW